MGGLREIYRPSLALLTDLYELTMAYGFWKSGVHDREAACHLFFRRCPFGGGYAVACGLSHAIDFLSDLRFDEEDVAYLGGLRSADGQPLFPPDFLEFLGALEFRCDVDGVPEGTVVFAEEPLVRVCGPIVQAQIVETALLNILNFQTLAATKAARVCLAARGEPVLEFGLRRAQGIDGGLAASRASYIGGCAATSNVLAGRIFGIPVRGTHAHSWIMLFDTEEEAFEAYAKAMPNNCVFLVDTYDTLEGVRKAVEVGRRLREQGHEMVGVRLDSGDLASLSIEARRILDEGGFPKAAIVASNDLDEHEIESLKERGAAIGVWGVGTRLATCFDDPALGGVYKLTAVRESGGEWRPKIKLSDEAGKTSTPGILQIRRFQEGARFVGDVICDASAPPDGETVAVDTVDGSARQTYGADLSHEDLLVPLFRRGELVYDDPPIDAKRARAQEQFGRLSAGTKRLADPERYPVGVEEGLHSMKAESIRKARNEA